MAEPGVRASLGILLTFWAGAAAIATLRERVVRYRPGQYVSQDVLSRVSFSYTNPEMVSELQQRARDSAPRVYRMRANCFVSLEGRLRALPEAAGRRQRQTDSDWAGQLGSDSAALLEKIHRESPEDYSRSVSTYMDLLRQAVSQGKLIVLPHEEREWDLRMPARRTVKVQSQESSDQFVSAEISRTFSDRPNELQKTELLRLVDSLAEQAFISPLSATIAGLTVEGIEATHQLDRDLTAAQQNEAARTAAVDLATRICPQKTVLLSQGSLVTPTNWKLLAEEQTAYVRSLSFGQRLSSHAGMALLILLIAAVLGGYVAMYQPRIVRNHARAAGIVALMLLTLLAAELAALGTGSLLVFGAGPVLLAALILAIAYDRRFALGVSTLQAMLVTLALGQTVGFFVILWLGVACACLLLDEVRTRSKLVEVGLGGALAMTCGAAGVGAAMGQPFAVIGRDCLAAGTAGLGAGLVALGILPFIERAFRITTGVKLLELMDASHPLLRKLALEAPGTYSHSLQVAALAEAAAEAIGADSLLCRAGSYYHDIGKIRKAEYFCENQIGGRSRHLNLTPSVSLLIILSHVKDGVELAREYNLPTILQTFIQQHHGTMLVEYFYHQACRQVQDAATPGGIPDTEYRYPGPKPRTRESAVVMIADAVEGACRSLADPTPGRIETLVHELIRIRLLDGQLSESELTFRELQLIEQALVKALLSIYHGRMTYPSTAAMTGGVSQVTKTAR